MSRAGIGLTALTLFLVLLPAFTGSYALSVATLILYFAYTGQAWNVMMGFAGQLSLGHSLYVGVGAYAAGALFFHYGIGPWAGLWVAMLLCAALGQVIGFLAFRFGISGVYFAFTDLPEWLKQVASVFPLKWIAQGMRSVFHPGTWQDAEMAGTWEHGRTALVLAAWFVLGLLVCVRTFRWTKRGTT